MSDEEEPPMDPEISAWIDRVARVCLILSQANWEVSMIWRPEFERILNEHPNKLLEHKAEFYRRLKLLTLEDRRRRAARDREERARREAEKAIRQAEVAILNPGPKNLVFLADGTWNGSDIDDAGNNTGRDPSNVLKMFRWLDGDDCQGENAMEDIERRLHDTKAPNTLRQVAKYIDGVGNNGSKLARLYAGMAGFGVIHRIVRGYTFLSRHYRPGDRIVLIGFSRGAYTVRALSEWIATHGLLQRDEDLEFGDEDELEQMAGAAWFTWKEAQAIRAHDDPGINAELVRQLGALKATLPALFSAPAPRQTGAVEVEVVAAYDTVGAMGVLYWPTTGPAGVLRRVDALGLSPERASDKIKRCYHALAKDERRIEFTPIPWQARAGIVQRLFPGAHADVGGGYPPAESGLSDHVLQWMQQQLADTLIWRAGDLPCTPNPWAAAHDESTKMCWWPRTGGRNFDDWTDVQHDQSIALRAQPGAPVAANVTGTGN